MEVFATLTAILAVLFIAAALWFLYCNEKTLDQRSEMIWSEPHPDKWEIFKSVTYDQHLWALFFFRNPYELYHKPSELEKILSGKR